MKNLSKSPAVLLAKRCDELFHDDMKNNGDPFKNFYKSLPICILDAVFSIGVRYKSVTNTVNSYIDTCKNFDTLKKLLTVYKALSKKQKI